MQKNEPLNPEELQISKQATVPIKPVDATEVPKKVQEVLGETEEKEFTDEEKKEIYIQELKDSKIKFHPTKHATKTVGTSTVVSLIGRERKVKNKETQTNIIINQFGSEYRKKRKHKNKFTKISRKSNRR